MNCSENVRTSETSDFTTLIWYRYVINIIMPLVTVHIRSSFFWNSDCLGCVVLLCLVVCLTLLAIFFLPFVSLINMYMTLIIMWYQRVCNCRQYCFALVRSHQCSIYSISPLVPRVYILKITQSSCGFLSMRFIRHNF